jgi:hypothetical protein
MALTPARLGAACQGRKKGEGLPVLQHTLSGGPHAIHHRDAEDIVRHTESS